MWRGRARLGTSTARRRERRRPAGRRTGQSRRSQTRTPRRTHHCHKDGVNQDLPGKSRPRSALALSDLGRRNTRLDEENGNREDDEREEGPDTDHPCEADLVEQARDEEGESGSQHGVSEGTAGWTEAVTVQESANAGTAPDDSAGYTPALVEPFGEPDVHWCVEGRAGRSAHDALQDDELPDLRHQHVRELSLPL